MLNEYIIAISVFIKRAETKRLIFKNFLILGDFHFPFLSGGRKEGRGREGRWGGLYTKSVKQSIGQTRSPRELPVIVML